jgi:hypothetical protein
MKRSLQTDPLLLALRDPRLKFSIGLDEVFAGIRYAEGSASIHSIRPNGYFLYLALMALHPNATREVLVWICEHTENESVLSCVACRPELPWEWISKLARHPDEVVRAGVPEYDLIVRDASQFVRDARVRHWKLPAQFFLLGSNLSPYVLKT